MSRLVPQEIIRNKREGGEIAPDEIRAFVKGVTTGEVKDELIAAFTMAVFMNGMSAAEQSALTSEMAASGRILDWRAAGLDGPAVDKHSTGGVGDKVSLIVAPLVAACGAYVPMISGRGLGHTGGTMDKLEAIPGYNAEPDLEGFMKIVREVGCSIIGQTEELAPADRRIYAVRDVTGTVESLPLITASILSKKLAAGLEYLVMDVKFGSGAFMRKLENARELAINIVNVAAAAGLPSAALLTDMNQVLGHSAGNALEVLEAADFLNGNRRDRRLEDCVLALAAQMLTGPGLAADIDDGHSRALTALEDGRAAEIFSRMVAAHGGPADFLDRPTEHLPAAPVIESVAPPTSGRITAIDVRAVGMTVVRLGGGRRELGDRVDPAVGLSEVAGLGDEVSSDRPLAFVHAQDESSARQAADSLRAAVTIDGEPPDLCDIVQETIPAKD